MQLEAFTYLFIAKINNDFIIFSIFICQCIFQFSCPLSCIVQKYWTMPTAVRWKAAHTGALLPDRKRSDASQTPAGGTDSTVACTESCSRKNREALSDRSQHSHSKNNNNKKKPSSSTQNIHRNRVMGRHTHKCGHALVYTKTHAQDTTDTGTWQ